MCINVRLIFYKLVLRRQFNLERLADSVTMCLYPGNGEQWSAVSAVTATISAIGGCEAPVRATMVNWYLPAVARPRQCN